VVTLTKPNISYGVVIMSASCAKVQTDDPHAPPNHGDTPGKSGTSTSGKPTALPVRPENIPAELKGRNHWVVWKYVKAVDLDTGEVDWNKPLFNARTGGLASSTKPATWSDFATACAAYERGGWDGIGFVLHRNEQETGVEVGTDLDDCRDPQTGAVQPWAQEIVSELGSYTEASPSGAGLRIFSFGDLPPEGRREGPFEVYQTGRYVTVTGCHIEGTPRTVEHRQEVLEKVHARMFARRKRKKEECYAPSEPTRLEDQEVLRRARACSKTGSRFGRLWDGDASDYKSRSEADLALCNYLRFWAGRDKERIDNLFRQSGLFRGKWNRDDYRNRTLDLALDGEVYDPSRNAYKASGNSAHHKEAPSEAQAITADAGNDPAKEPPIHLTDRGNALRLVKLSGNDLRFCGPWSKWLCWDGERWHLDQTGAVMREAKQTVVELFAEATKQMGEITNHMEGQIA
jgi:primase-polymerase (primpol)-like protein